MSVKACSIVFFSTYLLFALFIGEMAAVQVTNLRVPQIVEKGTPAILDCEYTLDAKTEEGFVLKWYFDTFSLVYQWIPGKRPHALGILKGKLDLDFSINNQTKEPNYRGLYIRNASINLTGEYSCVVSTLTSEDKQTKSMLVFAPPENFTMSQSLDSTQVICTAERVFPQPNVTISADNRKLETSVVALNDDYNRYSSYSVKAVANISSNSLVEKISCDLEIAEANYITKIEKMYHPSKRVSYNESSI